MENTNVQNEACANNCCHGSRGGVLYQIRSILVIILLLFAIAHLARGFFGHREFTDDRNGMIRSGEGSCMMAGMMGDHKMDMKGEKGCGCGMSGCSAKHNQINTGIVATGN